MSDKGNYNGIWRQWTPAEEQLLQDSVTSCVHTYVLWTAWPGVGCNEQRRRHSCVTHGDLLGCWSSVVLPLRIHRDASFALV